MCWIFFSHSFLCDIFMNCFSLFLLKLLFVLVKKYIPKLLVILLLIHDNIRNIITLLYSQLVLNVLSRSKAMFASYKQTRENGEHRIQESSFGVSCSLSVCARLQTVCANLSALNYTSLGDLYWSITDLLDHWYFVSLSHKALHPKHHSAMGSVSVKVHSGKYTNTGSKQKEFNPKI